MYTEWQRWPWLECRLGDRATHLKEAARDAHGLESEGLAWMQPFRARPARWRGAAEGARDLAVVELDSAARSSPLTT